MEDQDHVIEIEADSIEEAIKQANTRKPRDFSILSEEILSDGKRKSVKGVADTMETAFAQARDLVPAGAKIIEEKEQITPSQRFLEVEAYDEASAEKKAKGNIHKSGRIDSVRLKTLAKKGFLGIGKTPNVYEVKVLQPAVAKVTFKSKAKIRVKVGKKPEADRLLDELIEIGRTEGFLSMPRDSNICGRCGSKVVKRGVKVKCTYCGLEQNYNHFNETYKHIRAREIGTRLYDLGGQELMQKACYTVAAEHGASIGRELESAWAYIGGWLP